MKSRFLEVSKLLGINIFITGGILLIPEIILSKYFVSSDAYRIPETLIDFEKTFDVSGIERDNQLIKSKYSRDLDGYRPYKIPNNETEIMLTLGGSTVDQRYIDNNQTWQSIMEKNQNLSVINGGVDGQSSFGHVLAIKKWHSKILDNNKIDKVLFYLGVNDIRFAKSLDTAIGNVYDSPNLIRRLRAFLSRRSFLYSKLRQIKIKINIYRGIEFISPDGVSIAGHGITNPFFLTNPIESNIKLSSKEESKDYRELFKNLLTITTNTFQNAELYIVQQQDPKCLITDKKVFVRTNQDGIKAYCSALASIYSAQDQTLKKLKNPNIKLIKMYKDNPIPDEEFYDGIHTNSKGSYTTGIYLLDKIY